MLVRSKGEGAGRPNAHDSLKSAFGGGNRLPQIARCYARVMIATKGETRVRSATKRARNAYLLVDHLYVRGARLSIL